MANLKLARLISMGNLLLNSFVAFIDALIRYYFQKFLMFLFSIYINLSEVAPITLLPYVVYSHHASGRESNMKTINYK